MAEDRQWLLQHLAAQARYLAVLAAYAAEHPDEPDVLVRVRDEVFTTRETLDTLGVPHALVSNAAWAGASLWSCCSSPSPPSSPSPSPSPSSSDCASSSWPTAGAPRHEWMHRPGEYRVTVTSVRTPRRGL